MLNASVITVPRAHFTRRTLHRAPTQRASSARRSPDNPSVSREGSGWRQRCVRPHNGLRCRPGPPRRGPSDLVRRWRREHRAVDPRALRSAGGHVAVLPRSAAPSSRSLAVARSHRARRHHGGWSEWGRHVPAHPHLPLLRATKRGKGPRLRPRPAARPHGRRLDHRLRRKVQRCRSEDD